MRYVIILLISLFALNTNECYCQKKSKRALLKQQHELKVKECIQKDSLYIEIDRINPLGSTTKSSSYGYFVKLVNGKASIYLPYMGKMTSAVLGSERLAIEASEQPVKIQKERDDKEECTYYLFYFINKNRSERWECVFQAYDNGFTILKLSCSGRDSVGFHGNIKVD